MLSSYSKKVLKDTELTEKPVEIKVKDKFKSDIDLFSKDQEPRVKRVLQAATEEAEQIKEAAQKEAQEILVKAERKRADYVEEARQEGLKVGYAAGYDEGLKEAEMLKMQAEELLVQARQAYRKLMQQAKPNLIELAVLIAEKIFRQQISLNPEEIKVIVRGLLEENRAGETYYIYVHPSDSRILQDSFFELKEVTPKGVALNIVPDKRISIGSCRLETETAYYDATLEGQLRELKKVLQSGGFDA